MPRVLSDISFNLQPGSFYFLTGASGAGKTSLLKMLYLAQRPEPRDRAAVRRGPGQRCRATACRAFRRRIGVVFQDFRLIPHL
jgi:cell division transport system ATP-binding protein